MIATKERGAVDGPSGNISGPSRKRLQPEDRAYIHTTLRKALQDAVSDGLIPRNVADGIGILILALFSWSSLFRPR